MKALILATLFAAISMPALAGGIPAGRDPTWPQRLYDSGYQSPSDVIRAAPFTGLDPERIRMTCNADFALAQTVPDAPYSVTVNGLPTGQYKIETAHYGRVYQDKNGAWLSAKDKGVQIRGAATGGTQHFKIVYARPGGIDYDPDAPVKEFHTDDLYLTTDCK
ncbi:hypothetical protein ACU8NH_24240 [Rhizobium leguminosarum]